MTGFGYRALRVPLGMLALVCAISVNGKPSDCWTIARLKYGGGGDWYAGPTMLTNLQRKVKETLDVSVCGQEKTVSLHDADLYDHPILFMTGHGNVEFSEPERRVLRDYLLRGGLLFADDNYGLDASFRRELRALFPRHSLRALPNSHSIYNAHFRFPSGLPKIHEHDGKPAKAYGLEVDGRMVVLYTHETDLGNGWEDPEVHKTPPGLREKALRMGVNVVAWFLQGQSPK